jgi:peptidyl-prolyl cis-trans isomerase SurA
MQLYQVQTGMKPDSPEAAKKLREQLLQQMINDRLILAKAQVDTTIKVTDAEVDESLDRRIEDLKTKFPTEEEFNKQLEAEGYTFRELKAKLREEARDQLYKDRLISKLLSKISVGKSDVESFFKVYKDSLPEHPRSVKLAHILLKLSSSKSTADSLVAVARGLLDRINKGESFEELAKQYSQDPSAAAGGDIGTVRVGDLMPSFERAALALSPGGISDVVKSDLGYHIIKLVSKNGEFYNAKHILLLNKPVIGDSAVVLARADSLIDAIKKGGDFGSIVKELSADSASRANFGELGWYALEDLPEDYRNGVNDVPTGELSKPIWAPDGLHIFKVLDRKDSRPYSLTEDYDALKEFARRQKSQVVIAAVVEEMKGKVYIDLRDSQNAP